MPPGPRGNRQPHPLPALRRFAGLCGVLCLRQSFTQDPALRICDPVELFNDIRIGFDVAKVGDLVSLEHRVNGFLAHVEASGDSGER